MAEQFAPSRFAAVILAAGMSRRMGSPKALLDLGGRPMISRLVDTVRKAGRISPIIVVTGHKPELIQNAIGDVQGITFVQNDGYESGGMLSSIKVGAKSAATECDAFFLMLLDQPLVRAQSLNVMMDVWQKSRPTLVVPSRDGKRGHPILIKAARVTSITALPRSGTLKDFVSQNHRRAVVVEVNDPGVVSYLDTPEDYQRILSMWRNFHVQP